jgi:hypothetical protein
LPFQTKNQGGNEKMNKNQKKKLVCEVECPNCSQKLVILREVEIIQPMVPAEKTERYFAEKSTQTTLSV